MKDLGLPLLAASKAREVERVYQLCIDIISLSYNRYYITYFSICYGYCIWMYKQLM